MCLVPQERLELSRREASVPKTDVSANSTIGAVVLGVCQGVEFRHTPFLSSREVDDLEALKSVAITTIWIPCLSPVLWHLSLARNDA